MHFILAAALVVVSSFTGNLNAQTPGAKEEAHPIVAACSADCPEAAKAGAPKAQADATHKCAEKKGRLNKAFRRSKCWEVNEVYEKELAATQGK